VLLVVYFDFTMIAFIVAALKMGLETCEHSVTVHVATVNDHHLIKVEMTQQGSPNVRLVEIRCNRSQERDVNILSSILSSLNY